MSTPNNKKEKKRYLIKMLILCVKIIFLKITLKTIDWSRIYLSHKFFLYDKRHEENVLKFE